jgi:ankyrin repeat protein
MRTTKAVRALACLALTGLCTASCDGGPHLKRIGHFWYVDDVAGKASPRLYWVEDGKRIVVDREILAYEMSACLVYETSRPSLSRVVFAVLHGKSPAPIVASDSINPWRMSWDGLRHFDIPKEQEDGRTTLDMDFVSINDICRLAYRQPEFTADWTDRTPLNFTNVKIERTEFDVNGGDSVGNSTLSLEIQERHLEVVEELLRAGADANTANVAGGTPLMTAVAFDDKGTAILERLLDAGADIDAQNNGGETALMYAAKYGRKEALHILLARGANPAIRDNDGRTAAAVTGNSKEAAELSRILEEAIRRRREPASPAARQ